MIKPAFLLTAICALPLAACASMSPQSAQSARGLALAEARCASCHAVTAGDLSANPEAPAFAAIANQRELSRGTLRAFLRDSHNFPAAMNFTLRPADVDDLAAYMVTLQRADYHPPI
jgi:mono/diheme cytochrome c family protein